MAENETKINNESEEVQNVPVLEPEVSQPEGQGQSQEFLIRNNVLSNFFQKDDAFFEIFINDIMFLSPYKNIINELFTIFLTICSINYEKLKVNKKYLNVVVTIGRPTSFSIKSFDSLILSQVLFMSLKYIENVEYKCDILLPLNESEWLKTDETIKKLLSGEKVNYFDIEEEKRTLATRVCQFTQ